MLLYRLPEAQLVKLINPFLLDPVSEGGLGLSTKVVGFVYGTIGIIGLTSGGIVGGIMAARGGLRRWLKPMAWSMSLTCLTFVYLSYATEPSLLTINICVFVEQFGYGFGFTAYMLYLIYFSEGRHRTAHYSICTGFMALGMMLPGMAAGWLQETIGYRYFFIWTIVCCAATIGVCSILKIAPDFGLKKTRDGVTFINSVNIIIYYKDMILIADSGSTKVDWCFVEGASIVKQVSTSGINPVVMSEDEVSACIGGQLMPQMEGLSPASVHFYGAGCVSDEKCAIVASAISGHIPDVSVTVDSDMLAAARAICGSDPGIACILGTGSNSCVYDGRHIIDNVSPLGYILGDEGSGAVLGKMLVGDVLKRQLPEELCARFLEQYSLDRLTVIDRVYRQPQANRFLASLTPFLLENISDPAVYGLVLRAFISFFERNVANYSSYRDMAVGFVGSIAYYYRDVLADAAGQFGCTLGRILRSPMEGLVEYHTKKII